MSPDMDVFKVIVAGSRLFLDYEFLKDRLDLLLAKKEIVQIVSGTARGADTLGEKYAVEKGYHISKFPAHWDSYGKKAGYIRNEEMARYADACVIFNLDNSAGSNHMENIAVKYNLNLRVYRLYT